MLLGVTSIYSLFLCGALILMRTWTPPRFQPLPSEWAHCSPPHCKGGVLLLRSSHKRFPDPTMSYDCHCNILQLKPHLQSFTHHFCSGWSLSAQGFLLDHWNMWMSISWHCVTIVTGDMIPAPCSNIYWAFAFKRHSSIWAAPRPWQVCSFTELVMDAPQAPCICYRTLWTTLVAVGCGAGRSERSE